MKEFEEEVKLENIDIDKAADQGALFEETIEETRREAKEAAEVPVQNKVVMVQEWLKDAFRPEDWGISKDTPAVNDEEEPYNTREDILKALSDRKEIYFPTGEKDQEGKSLYRIVRVKNGMLYVTEKPFTINQYPDMEDYKRILPDFLQGDEFTTACDAEGKIYQTPEEINQELSKGDKRLAFQPEDEDYRVVVENRYDGLYVCTQSVKSTIFSDKEPDSTRLLYWKEKDILYAEDGEGKKYEKPEEIRKALEDNGSRLYLFTREDKDYPYVIKKENDSYFVSQWTVEMKNRETLDESSFKEAEDLSLKEDYILKWKAEDVDAIEVEGKRITDKEEIRYALKGLLVPKNVYDSMNPQVREHLPRNDRKFNVFVAGEEHPYKVELKRERYFISDEAVMDIDKIPEDDFIPCSTFRHDLEKRWPEREGDILYALDQDGKVLKNYDEICDALEQKDQQLIVIEGSQGEYRPYAIEVKDGRLCVSDKVIGPENRLPQTEAFVPQKSLDLDPMIDFALHKKSSQVHKMREDEAKKVKALKEDLKQRQELEKNGLPQPPKQPKKPSLGFFNTVWWGVKKVITLGFGDTDANRTYREKLKVYEEKDVPKYKAAVEDYEKLRVKKEGNKPEIERLTKIIEKHNKELDWLKPVDAELSVIIEKQNNESRQASYRNLFEVKAMGAIDYMQKKKITKENLFAYTWMQEGNLNGKTLKDDPGVKENLYDYLAAKIVENQIYKDRASFETVSDSLDDRKIRELNNGQAKRILKNDPVLQKLLSDPEELAKPLDAYDFLDKYLKEKGRIEAREKDSAERLTKFRDQLVKDFGEKAISEDAVDDVIRYMRATKVIKAKEVYKNADKMENLDSKEQAKIFFDARFDMAKVNFRIKRKEREELLPAVQALKGKGPMTLDKMAKAIAAKRKELQEAQKNLKVGKAKAK